jgi:hypothetical protein
MEEGLWPARPTPWREDRFAMKMDDKGIGLSSIFPHPSSIVLILMGF